LAVPDLDQIKKQRKQGARDPRGRFAKGRSGNPASRPRGCRDQVNRAARLLLAGEGEAVTRKAVELALAAAAHGAPRRRWVLSSAALVRAAKLLGIEACQEACTRIRCCTVPVGKGTCSGGYPVLAEPGL
jgi:hypothetical protein